MKANLFSLLSLVALWALLIAGAGMLPAPWPAIVIPFALLGAAVTFWPYINRLCTPGSLEGKAPTIPGDVAPEDRNLGWESSEMRFDSAKGASCSSKAGAGGQCGPGEARPGECPLCEFENGWGYSYCRGCGRKFREKDAVFFTPEQEDTEREPARDRAPARLCITCGEEGHTYLECPKVNFFDLFAASFGLPDITTGESADELRDRVAEALWAQQARLTPDPRDDGWSGVTFPKVENPPEAHPDARPCPKHEKPDPDCAECRFSDEQPFRITP